MCRFTTHFVVVLLGFLVVSESLGEPAPKKANDSVSQPLPQGAVLRLGDSRFRHGGPIRLLEITRDGRFLLTGGSDRMMCLWEPSGKLVRSWPIDRPNPIASLMPDSDSIVGDWDGERLEFRTYFNDKPKERLKLPEMDRLLCSPDGRTIAVLFDGAVTLRTPELKAVGGKVTKVEQFAYAPDGKSLFTAGEDGTIHQYDIPDLKHLGSFQADAAKAKVTHLSVTKEIVFSADQAGKVHVWNLAKRALATTIQASGPIASSADGSKLIAVVQEQLALIHVADPTRRTLLGSAKGIESVVVSPQGDHLYTAGAAHRVRIWDLKEGKEQIFDSGHLGDVVDVVVSSDGKKVLTASEDGLRAWNLDRGNEILESRRAIATRSMRASPDTTRLAIVGSEKFSLWSSLEWTTAKILPEKSAKPLSLQGQPPVGVIAYSPKGNEIAFADGNKRMVFIDPIQGTIRGPALSLDGQPHAAAYSPTTHHLAVMLHDGSLQMWSLADRINPKPEAKDEIVWRRRCGRTGKASLQFTADGLLVAATHGGRVALMESMTGSIWSTYDRQFGDGFTQTFAFSPNGRHLAVGHGSPHGVIRVWELFTGKAIVTFQGHLGGVSSIAFTPDGRKLITGSSDSTVLVWDLTLPAVKEEPEISVKDAWELLDHEDTKTAYRAMGTMVRGGNESIPLIRTGLAQVSENEARYRKWIMELEDAEFKVRRTARNQLMKAGLRALPVMREALEKKPSAETERVIQLIMEELDRQGIRATEGGLFGETLRAVRAVYLLESIGGKEAIAVLESLANAKVSTRVSTEAKAALGRMSR